MKPEFNSRRLFGITRSKGKMYEFGLPESSHIAVPPNDEPEALFVLTVGTLGDVAAYLSGAERADVPLTPSTADELGFSASFFDAFLASRFEESISYDVTLLAASAYYLARRPGSSLVLARRLEAPDEEPAVDKLLRWVLQAKWAEYPLDHHPILGDGLVEVAKLLAYHFRDGSGAGELSSALVILRRRAYAGVSARELLFIDIISAIVRMRLAASAWTTLPSFTQIAADQWSQVIRRPEFPKELWPSQALLGHAGFFAGASGIIQMPTSAGKTRSVEIVLRSAFLSGRAKLAVVVAPFRALCHEIGTSLRHAFRQDDVKVNELSDALQVDFLEQIAELLGSEAPSSRYILVLTPEKLLYVLRQAPALVNDIGIVVYDEGHQFDSGSRGITYELLLTEIKALLPVEAQTILVSAVIRNAQAIGGWLIGDTARVVNGTGLLPTARSVAFATWLERLGQLVFFESDTYDRYDYFVPRAIEQQKLGRRPGEKKERHFPEKGKNAWKEISLYLGIRLASQGAVAIFCGRKDTASGLAKRAVEIYERGYSLEMPATFASTDEIRRMKNLIDGYFGSESVLSRAAVLGVFVHHSNTPHGLRLSIEHAMQKGRINFVACTSTLAQGVNLPIRYLIVSGIYQAGERIKTRDFQNLIGRAGRAGMHTEGLVIFADPVVYDKRLSERWRFDMSVNLLAADQSEDTTSSLLGLLGPLRSVDGRTSLPPAPDVLCRLLLSDEQTWLQWANDVAQLNREFGFEAKHIVAELRRRRRLLSSVESYLMANRGVGSFEEFKAGVQRLAMATLAYHLASDDEKVALTVLFGLVADYVQGQAPAQERQAFYSKTLLGVKNAMQIEEWVNLNRELLLGLETNEEWLAMVWPLFAEQSEDKFFHSIEPTSLPAQLATSWLQGVSYRELIEDAAAENGIKPWGDTQRRKITDEDVIDFCENTLGFECSLVLAAVAQFLFGERAMNDEGAIALTLFQKALKYGLPDWLSISSFERGFADRIVAQRLRDTLLAAGYSGGFFGQALRAHRDLVASVLTDFPTYFESVLEGVA